MDCEFCGVCQRLHWRCHAYCLMSNRYHIVIENPEANLSKGMRQLDGVYTQVFNRRHHPRVLTCLIRGQYEPSWG